MTGLEPFIIPAANGVATIVIKTLVEQGGWLAKTLGRGVSEETQGKRKKNLIKMCYFRKAIITQILIVISLKSFSILLKTI